MATYMRRMRNNNLGLGLRAPIVARNTLVEKYISVPRTLSNMSQEKCVGLGPMAARSI